MIVALQQTSRRSEWSTGPVQPPAGIRCAHRCAVGGASERLGSASRSQVQRPVDARAAHAVPTTINRRAYDPKVGALGAKVGAVALVE
ncbi:hypothetical protein T484DRAFT_1877949 [Baffinella frigidus]|nr:hypothetical protein T484DRAFT_1877949 [Cryptophyta sp. CCMP2293]